MAGLEDYPFDYHMSRAGLLQISYRGRVVTTLQGAAAAKLFGKLASSDEDGAQLLLAKATGNFKRGNERPAR